MFHFPFRNTLFNKIAEEISELTVLTASISRRSNIIPSSKDLLVELLLFKLTVSIDLVSTFVKPLESDSIETLPIGVGLQVAHGLGLLS